MTPFVAMRDGVPVTVRFRGGLLGHWSVWTKGAVELLERCKQAVAAAEAGPNGAVAADLLALDSRVSDCNSAFFDVANDFAGCIAGCHEVLRRQGLLEGIWCLDPHEGLGPASARDRSGAEGARRSRRRRLRRRPPGPLASLIENHDTPANIDGVAGEFLTAESVTMAIAIPAPRVRVLGVEAFEQPFRLRMPFRFGVITLTEGIQAFVRVQVRLGDGREGFGYAAEMLSAKWFDKNPLLS